MNKKQQKKKKNKTSEVKLNITWGELAEQTKLAEEAKQIQIKRRYV